MEPQEVVRKLKKSPATRLSTRNVRTMCCGLFDDRHLVTDVRKTALIDSELEIFDMDIALLLNERL